MKWRHSWSRRSGSAWRCSLKFWWEKALAIVIWITLSFYCLLYLYHCHGQKNSNKFPNRCKACNQASLHRTSRSMTTSANWGAPLGLKRLSQRHYESNQTKGSKLQTLSKVDFFFNFFLLYLSSIWISIAKLDTSLRSLDTALEQVQPDWVLCYQVQTDCHIITEN